MIRKTVKGKRSYQSIGISILPKYWNFKKNMPRMNCPNRDLILAIIEKKVYKYKLINKYHKIMKAFCDEHLDEINEIEAQNKVDYDDAVLEHYERTGMPPDWYKPVETKTVELPLETKLSTKTVQDVFNERIEYYKSNEQINTGDIYTSTRNIITQFAKGDIYFESITLIWLRDFETWLRKEKKVNNTTINMRIRHLKTIWNIAIDEEIISNNLFKRYKMPKSEVTKVKSLSSEEIERFKNYHSKNTKMQYIADLFLFSYYVGGLNFTDIARLKDSNIDDKNMISFERKKTGTFIRNSLTKEARDIIKKYYKKGNIYLFPILSPNLTEKQKISKIKSITRETNKRLKVIAKELNLSIKDITTYTARDTFATEMMRKDVPIKMVSKSLGHTTTKTTEKHYLGDYEDERKKKEFDKL
jgi:integrase